MSYAIINKTKEQYNAIAREWDISRYTPSGIKIKQINKLKKGEKFLDLGCGNGLLVPGAMKKGVQYTGVDISSELIKIARKKYPGVDFLIGDATKKLKFKNNNFDKVFSFALMHHIPTKRLHLKFLKEIYRVLKNGGEAVIMNWNLFNEKLDKRYNISEQLKTNKNNDVCVPWKATKDKIVERYVHIFTKKEMLDLAEQAGFKSARVNFYHPSGKKEKNGEELVLLLKK